MADKRLGWSVLLGVSCTTIDNGMFAKEHGPEDLGGDGTLVPDIEVFVPELVPFADGKKPEEKTNYEVELKNPLIDITEKRNISLVSAIKCKYMGGQNFSVPCVHRGEQVWVLQYEGGESSYYWLPMGRDSGIRMREHVRWYAHNLPVAVKGDNQFSIVSDDHTYFICMDTRTNHKLIQIHTSRNDGEEYGYDIRIHPEQQKLEICDTAGGSDNQGNRIELDSKNTKWTIRNIYDSFIKLDKEDISISCKGMINITAGKGIRNRAGWADDYITGQETQVAGNAGTINTITGTHTETEVTKTVNATSTHNGNVTVNGHERVSAGMTITGDAVIDGKTFDTHLHIGNMGAPTTPPVR